jgi:hypothetical protein
MDKEILDIYSDYLLVPSVIQQPQGYQDYSKVLLPFQITRFLSDKTYTPADLWLLVKPILRQVQSPTAVLIFDDSIEEKPYTDENEIICWHWDHSKNRSVKGINFMTGPITATMFRCQLHFN